MDAFRIAARLILASLALAPVAALHAAEAPPAEAFGALLQLREGDTTPIDDGDLRCARAG